MRWACFALAQLMVGEWELTSNFHWRWSLGLLCRAAPSVSGRRGVVDQSRLIREINNQSTEVWL